MSRQWLEVALGVWMAGGCVVPVNHQVSREQVLRCLGRSGCEWIVVQDDKTRRWLRGQGEGLPASLTWMLLEGADDASGAAIETLADVKENGRGLVARGRVEELAESVFQMGRGAPATILFEAFPGMDPHGALYTGETFQRMLGHLAASLWEGSDTLTAIVAEPGRPPACLVALSLILSGSPLAVTEASESVASKLTQLEPTHLVCHPGFLRRHTAQARDRLEQAPEFMRGTDRSDEPESKTGGSLGLESLIGQLGASAAERLVYRPLRRSMGGELETALIAGEPLRSPIARVVENAGVSVIHQFSLPECGISHLEHPDQTGPDHGGAAGRGQPIDGYRCRIGGDQDDSESAGGGDIQIQADCLFDDYWDRTGPRAIEEDWLRTGVRGRIVKGTLVVEGEQNEP